LFTAAKILTPKLKLDAQNKVEPLISISFLSSGKASVQPVVPHTTGTPAAKALRILLRATCGAVNSIATCALLKASDLKSSRLFTSTIETTSCPRSRAILSITVPSFPYPINAILILPFLC